MTSEVHRQSEFTGLTKILFVDATFENHELRRKLAGLGTFDTIFLKGVGRELEAYDQTALFEVVETVHFDEQFFGTENGELRNHGTREIAVFCVRRFVERGVADSFRAKNPHRTLATLEEHVFGFRRQQSFKLPLMQMRRECRADEFAFGIGIHQAAR